LSSRCSFSSSVSTGVDGGVYFNDDGNGGDGDDDDDDDDDEGDEGDSMSSMEWKASNTVLGRITPRPPDYIATE
jgi:hypothetical protein